MSPFIRGKFSLPPSCIYSPPLVQLLPSVVIPLISTVNKLRSLNLHFSNMLCIERKVVHSGAEKIITLYLYQVSVKFEDFSFTFNDAEDYARGGI
jgi:hypothetical protein